MAASNPGVSYGQCLTDVARARPDDADLIVVARDGTERAVTWRELETRANQIARSFKTHRVGKNDVVLIALPNCLDHILATLATWKLGATVLPARHDLPQWEMDRLLDIALPVALVSDNHGLSGRSSERGVVVTTDDLASSGSLPDGELEICVSECVNLIASSGSTGTPKLIVSPRRGVVAHDPEVTYSHHDAKRILVTSPLYHGNGFNNAAPPLLRGSRSIVMEKFDASLAVRLIERHQIDYTVMVPTMLQRIARLEDVRPEQLASLKTLIYGGARIPEWLVDRWVELVPPAVFNFAYGSSEGLGAVRMTGLDWAEHRGSTGRPVDVTISIRDDEGMQLPVGEVGQIFMRPLDPNRRLFSYIGIPTPAPTADGFRTIGDLGSLDADGYLYIADRRTDLIVTGGANVFPAEVEAALSEHPGVVDQVVVGVPDDHWGHRVHAIVQPSDSSNPPSAEELRAHCKQRLASYKAPKTYELVDRVPRNEAGKLNRTKLGAERGAESS